jgi:hypothetical protein
LKLQGRLLATFLHGVGDTVTQVIVEKQQRDGLQSPCRGRNLLKDVDALTVVFDHALQAANLALDSAQALLKGLFVVAVARSH